ncbi:MAG: MBL fold metallo-hydrolase, partial [Promethearchaeota archaeon]
MKVQKIGSRGYLFIFPDFNPFPQVSMSIQIYVINGKSHLFICDTGLGIEQMNGIKQYLKKKSLDTKPIIVFNSHFHLDHIGGNGAFEGAKIISHILCREKMIKSIEDITEEDKKFL